MKVRRSETISLGVVLPMMAAFLIGNVECFTGLHIANGHSIMTQHFYMKRRSNRCPAPSEQQQRLDPFSMSSNTGDEETKEELTQQKVAEMIEVSFVNGVMQLAQGYVDVLKLFIVAVQSGYSMGISPKKLLEIVADCPVQSANRPLMNEEVQLRTTWMQLVYLVLDFVQYGGKTLEEFSDPNEIDETIRVTYSKTIPILARAKEHGLSFDAERVKECSNVLPNSMNMDDPMENALISQSLRIIWLTLVVLDEEEYCAEDKKPVKPQPPIPGAFD